MDRNQPQPRAQSPFPQAGGPAQGHQSRRSTQLPGRRPGLLLLGAGLLLASQAPALAGSVTAESIWDRSNAIERATSQIPRGATVTGNSCQEVDMRGGSTRYICTVTYSPAPPAQAASPDATPAASPSVPGSNGPGASGPSPNAPSAPAP
jgi:hypothetical protein